MKTVSCLLLTAAIFSLVLRAEKIQPQESFTVYQTNRYLDVNNNPYPEVAKRASNEGTLQVIVRYSGAEVVATSHPYFANKSTEWPHSRTIYYPGGAVQTVTDPLRIVTTSPGRPLSGNADPNNNCIAGPETLIGRETLKGLNTIHIRSSFEQNGYTYRSDIWAWPEAGCLTVQRINYTSMSGISLAVMFDRLENGKANYSLFDVPEAYEEVSLNEPDRRIVAQKYGPNFLKTAPQCDINAFKPEAMAEERKRHDDSYAGSIAQVKAWRSGR